LADPAHEIDAAFAQGLAECALVADAPNLHWWLNSFFLPILTVADKHTIRYKVILPACEILLKRLITSEGWGQPTSLTTAKFFKRAFFAGVEFASMKEDLATINEQSWLTVPSLTPLIPVALCLGLPTAHAALAAVCHDPTVGADIFRKLFHLDPALTNTGDNANVPRYSIGQLDIALAIAFARSDASPVLHWLRIMLQQLDKITVRDALQQRATELLQIRAMVLDPGYQAPRGLGYELLSSLVELASLPAVKLMEIQPLLVGQSGTSTNLEVVPLLVQAALGGELDAAVEKLLELGHSVPSTRRGPLIHALHSVLAPSRAVPSHPVLEKIAAFYSLELNNEPQAHLLGKVALALCRSNNISAAHQIAIALVNDTAVRALSTKQKRRLAHHLDKTFQRLFDSLNTVQIELYLDALSSMDSHLGRLIVVALCKCRRQDRNHLLQEILTMPTAHIDLKHVVQDYLRFRLGHTKTVSVPKRSWSDDMR
jgi:hypothetical protein